MNGTPPKLTVGESIESTPSPGCSTLGETTGASKGVMLTYRKLVANAMHYLILAAPILHRVPLFMALMFRHSSHGENAF